MFMSLDERPLGTVVPGSATASDQDRVQRAAMIYCVLPQSRPVHPEVVARLRVLDLLQHLADEDLREVGHHQRLDLNAEAREDIGRVLRRHAIEVDEVAEPLVGNAHQNCSKKRRSDS
jgi:hypothetical protein